MNTKRWRQYGLLGALALAMLSGGIMPPTPHRGTDPGDRRPTTPALSRGTDPGAPGLRSSG
jgi:hypothetical protein